MVETCSTSRLWFVVLYIFVSTEQPTAFSELSLPQETENTNYSLPFSGFYPGTTEFSN